MRLYQIDYKRLVLLLLPAFLRKTRIGAFLYALTFGVSELHMRYLKNREADLLRIKRNGQVCYLRGLLNDELDAEKRRITISDEKGKDDWLFVMSEGDAYQLLIEHPWIMVYREDTIIGGTAFFNVRVPWQESNENLNNRLKDYLNQYKLLSKKYKIS